MIRKGMIHLLKLCLAAGLLGLISCQVAGPSGTSPKRAHEEWPSHIAGQARHVVANDYVVYAKDPVAAERLSVWLREELTAFRSVYEGTCDGKGLVFAVEPGVELPLTVAAWRTQNVDRSRLIVWTSPIRLQTFMSLHGRPYCLNDEPYFLESFQLPVDEAIRLGVVPEEAKPAWICFLATDEHITTSFDVTLQHMKREHAKWVRDVVPLVVRLLSFPAILMYSAVYESWVFPRYRMLDLDLMHLQRRETVRKALIGCSTADLSKRRLKLQALQTEVDDAWKGIWVRRPLD